MLPIWVQRDLKALRNERNKLIAVSNDQTAYRRAVVRLLLVRQITAALESENQALLVRTAALIDVRNHLDLWMEGVGASQAAWLDSPSIKDEDPVSSLDRLANEAFAERLDSGEHRGGVGGLRRAAERVTSFGWHYQTRRALRQGITALTGDPPASESVLEALAASFDTLSDSLEITCPKGPRALMLAVREVDRQIEDRLALIERQASWLMDCDDPWNSPQARFLLRRLHELAALRSALVDVTEASRFAALEGWKREELLAMAEQITAGGVSAAKITADMERIVKREEEDGAVLEALMAVNWPEHHIIQRVGWRPGRMVGQSGWVLIERVRERDAQRATGNLSPQCDSQVRRAAADVLKIVGR